MVRALPGSQVISPSSFNTSRWCHTVVVDLPTVLAISLTVVGWVAMTVLRTVIRDTERMLAKPIPCSRVGVRSRHTTEKAYQSDATLFSSSTHMVAVSSQISHFIDIHRRCMGTTDSSRYLGLGARLLT